MKSNQLKLNSHGDGSVRLEELSCKIFASKLASKEPVPGGGGVSALVGALSAALCSMVGNLTTGKKKYADVEEEIQSGMKQAESLRIKLLSMIEADAEAFYPLSQAYGLPATTEKEKRIKSETLESCLKVAAAVPFEIMETICEVIQLSELFAKKGSVLAQSDAGVAAALAEAALKSADLNVRINTKLMKDRDYADQLNQRCDIRLKEGCQAASDIYQLVAAAMSN